MTNRTRTPWNNGFNDGPFTEWFSLPDENKPEPCDANIQPNAEPDEYNAHENIDPLKTCIYPIKTIRA